jgi:hypothetical protein
MAHKVTIIEGTTPTGGGRQEFRIVCDKCGLVDKAGSEREAKSAANRHRDFPQRSLMQYRK